MPIAELVLVIGPCGAGKTTWARATYPGHAHADMEELARTLFAIPAQFRYHPWTRAVGRRLLHHTAGLLLDRGRPTCVTAGGATRSDRATWTHLATAHGAPTHLVRLLADPEACVHRARADERRPRSSRAAWPAIVANWHRDWEPVGIEAEGLASYREVIIDG